MLRNRQQRSETGGLWFPVLTHTCCLAEPRPLDPKGASSCSRVVQGPLQKLRGVTFSGDHWACGRGSGMTQSLVAPNAAPNNSRLLFCLARQLHHLRLCRPLGHPLQPHLQQQAQPQSPLGTSLELLGFPAWP